MIALLCFLLTLFASLFKSKSRLEAENAALRHQLIVLQRRMRGRVHLTSGDRLFLVGTARPSAHWIARQLTEAYGWQGAPSWEGSQDRLTMYFATLD